MFRSADNWSSQTPQTLPSSVKMIKYHPASTKRMTNLKQKVHDQSTGCKQNKAKQTSNLVFHAQSAIMGVAQIRREMKNHVSSNNTVCFWSFGLICTWWLLLYSADDDCFYIALYMTVLVQAQAYTHRHMHLNANNTWFVFMCLVNIGFFL